MKFSRLTELADKARKTIDDLKDQVNDKVEEYLPGTLSDSGSSDSGSSDAGAGSAYAPPASASAAPPAVDYQAVLDGMIAEAGPDNKYYLMPREDAERIISPDTSIVEITDTSCVYDELLVELIPAADVVSHEGDVAVAGVGDEAWFNTSDLGMGAADGNLVVRVGDQGIRIMIVGREPAEGSVPIARLQEATVEAAQTVIRNLR